MYDALPMKDRKTNKKKKQKMAELQNMYDGFFRIIIFFEATNVKVFLGNLHCMSSVWLSEAYLETCRSSLLEVFLRKDVLKICYENMQQIHRGTPIPKCDFNKVANHASAWVSSCKFAAYFQNTSS